MKGEKLYLLLNGELSVYLDLKSNAWYFKLIWGFVDKDRAKILAMRNFIEYFVRLVKGKIITVDEACDLLDIASQKIQAL